MGIKAKGLLVLVADGALVPVGTVSGCLEPVGNRCQGQGASDPGGVLHWKQPLQHPVVFML